MWLNLAKVTPDLLNAIKAEPELIDRLFFDEDGSPLEGVDPERDVFGCDYLTLGAVAAAMARGEEADGEDLDRFADADEEWRDSQPWLARAVGEEASPLGDYEFTYGAAYCLDADQVRAIRDGLVDEGWELVDSRDEPEEYDDFVDLLPFFDAAAREGKAIVGGIS
jgi:hypothetical protein